MMNSKISVCCLIFMTLLLSCNENVVKANSHTPETPVTTKLKSSAFITKYFVAKTGNDNNPGTSSAPFLTIGKAVQVTAAGDSVIVRDGTYVGASEYMVSIYCSGSESNYIVFKSEHKYGAVLDGNNISGYCFAIEHGSSYLKFIDFEIKNFLYFGFKIGEKGYTSSYVTIQGCKIHDIGRPESTSEYGRCAIFIAPHNHHISIDKNLMYNIGRTGPDSYWLNKDHAVYIADPSPNLPANASHHNYITYNLMFNNSGCAITMGSNNDLIANNVMAWSNENSRGGGCFIAATSSGCFNETIANNIFYQPPASNAFAMISYCGYSGWSVRSNLVYGGRLWDPESHNGYAAIMDGGNYGRTDCEHGEVNPSFVSAQKAKAPDVDFRLQAKSPAINAGINIGLTSDFEGNPIIGLPDIGAYEYGGSNSLPGGN
jgi:hypothetical protein